MIYTQNLEGCEAKGIDETASKDALDHFRKAFEGGHLAPLSLVQKTDDLSLLKEKAQSFSQWKDILILGIGGSSLGGRTLYALSDSPNRPYLHFVDNIDPATFSRWPAKLNPATTGVLVISKSGSTAETLMQLLTIMETFGHTNPEQFMVITEPTDNPLRRIAEAHGWPCFDHPTNVGGRYSCFSLVGVLPMLLAGLDPVALREGANTVLQTHLNEDNPAALEGAALAVHFAKQGKNISVMMPYSDQLSHLSAWYGQLWAESLGKDGQGTTPVQALGAVDQHSQLQLYLAGPKDKFMTLLVPHWEGKGRRIEGSVLPEFQGKTMGDLFAAEARATYETLVRNHCPTRLITLPKLDEYHLGGLMMHFMIETILASYLLSVNAFDQPAVEEGKILARRYMAA